MDDQLGTVFDESDFSQTAVNRVTNSVKTPSTVVSPETGFRDVELNLKTETSPNSTRYDNSATPAMVFMNIAPFCPENGEAANALTSDLITVKVEMDHIYDIGFPLEGQELEAASFLPLLQQVVVSDFKGEHGTGILVPLIVLGLTKNCFSFPSVIILKLCVCSKSFRKTQFFVTTLLH